MDFAGILVRIAITYLFLLLLLRLSGKRTIREGTPFDLVVALILGDFPDDVIWGEVPVAQGVVALGTIMTLHLAMTYASYRSTWFDQLLGAIPTVVLDHGRSDARGLRTARMNEGDLDVVVRHAGVTDRDIIAEARIEPSGQPSVRLVDLEQPARRRDLGDVA